MHNIRYISFFIGLFISSVMLYLAIFQRMHNWYYPMVIGVWFIFDFISSKKNRNSTLSFILRGKFRKYLQIYISLFVVGALIEIIGRYLLGLWIYTNFTSVFNEIILVLFYPFILMSFREMYESLVILIKNRIFSFFSSMLAGILIWELPNMFSNDWVYTIPVTSLEILNLDIAIILGWGILIALPLLVYKFLKI